MCVRVINLEEEQISQLLIPESKVVPILEEECCHQVLCSLILLHPSPLLVWFFKVLSLLVSIATLSIHIRNLHTILFYHLKTYFIIYTIPFYVTLNIPTFIFLFYSLK